MDVSLESLDILDIALNLLDKGTAHDLELFFIVAWTVWWNRNQATHDDIGSPPIQTWEITNRTLLDYTSAISNSLPSQPSSISSWKAPAHVLKSMLTRLLQVIVEILASG